jgi:hypothetical protein
VRGNRCDACGSPQETRRERDTGDDVPTKQNAFRPYASKADADTAGLERATEAFRAKDLPRFLDTLVNVEATTVRSAPTPEGPGWIATVRGALVFVTMRAQSDEIVLEAPIARLPERHRLPALRLALELCAHESAASRIVLRGDLLLVRWSAKLSVITPPVLRHYLREVGHLASRYTSLFTVGLDAPVVIADDMLGSAGFDLVGRPKKVHVGAAGGRRSMPPPDGKPAKPIIPAPAQIDGASRPRAAALEDSRPAVTAGFAMGRTAQNESQAKVRPPRREEDSAPAMEAPPAADPIPAILSPALSSAPASTPAAEERGKRPIPAPAPAPVAVEPPRKPIARTDADLQEQPAKRAGGSSAELSPSDRLCMLLRHAQSLASLTLEERPASMGWLVRSTVFRAVYEFKDSVPDAVAHLYRCTAIGKQERNATSPTEPALVVMERVIVARGLMPKEKTLAIEPMTSAAQAKEHVARYLSEIDKAPNDSGLRHFLALGALTELLVRTKLPPQTDQRLRDIVAHAQKEGAKGAATDLMMTALQRINS